MRVDGLSRPMLIICTLAICLSCLMFVVDYTIANVAIPYIAGGLAAGVDEGTYVLTSFAVGNGVVLPITGWLVKKFGSVHTLLMAVFGFTLCSFLCGASPNLGSLVIFRFLQGASAGPLVPLGQSMLAQMYPAKDIPKITMIFSMVVLLGPILGPVLGGYFCVYYDWRWIFYINIPFGVVCLLILGIGLNPFNDKDHAGTLDWLSVFLLVVSMCTLQMCLDKGQQWDWWGSNLFTAFAVTFIITFFYLIYASFVLKKPLMDLYLFKNPLYALSVILIFSTYFFYIGSIVAIPLWLQTAMRYDALWAGIAVAPIGLGSILVSPFIVKLIVRIGNGFGLAIGITMMMISCIQVRYFTPQVSIYVIGFSRFILGVGIAFWVNSLFRIPLVALKRDDLSMGLGIFHFLRAISGGVATSVVATLYKRRTTLHHHDLVDTFNPFRLESNEYLRKIQEMGFTEHQSLLVSDRLVTEQASVIAINEIFWFLSWVCVFGIILSLFTAYFERRLQKKDQSLPKEIPIASE